MYLATCCFSFAVLVLLWWGRRQLGEITWFAKKSLATQEILAST